jgi:hypothetical protein
MRLFEMRLFEMRLFEMRLFEMRLFEISKAKGACNAPLRIHCRLIL